MPLPFRDRLDAGRQLSAKLQEFHGDPDAVVLALPRGGVPVGFAVARELGLPLDVFLVRKLGVPGQEELAFGAIASGGVRVLNQDILELTGLGQEMIEAISRRETAELERRDSEYRRGRPALPVFGRTVLLVDDGLATGATMLAAVRAVGALEPRRVIAAAPLGSCQACRDFEAESIEIVCAYTPEPFSSVGAWYEDFRQTGDQEVRTLLEQAAHAPVA